MNNVDDLVLKENVSKYEQTRKRLSNVDLKYRTCSDKEIIEYLAEEIEQYRNRIDNQKKIIDYLSKLKENKKEIDYSQNLKELQEKDIKEIVTTDFLIEGGIVKTITQYKFEDENINKESNIIIKDKLISNEQDYKKDNEDLLDDDIEEIITTSQMADGKIIKTITEYKYKEN